MYTLRCASEEEEEVSASDDESLVTSSGDEEHDETYEADEEEDDQLMQDYHSTISLDEAITITMLGTEALANTQDSTETIGQSDSRVQKIWNALTMTGAEKGPCCVDAGNILAPAELSQGGIEHVFQVDIDAATQIGASLTEATKGGKVWVSMVLGLDKGKTCTLNSVYMPRPNKADRVDRVPLVALRAFRSARIATAHYGQHAFDTFLVAVDSELPYAVAKARERMSMGVHFDKEDMQHLR